MKKLFIILSILFFSINTHADITKGLIAKEDLRLYDGITPTFTRPTSTGGTETYTKTDYNSVDVLQVYGDGSTKSDVAINEAISQIGASIYTSLYLSAGTWVLSNNVDLSSTNLKIRLDAGAVFSGTGRLILPDGHPYKLSWRRDFNDIITDIGTINTVLEIDIDAIVDSGTTITIPDTLLLYPINGALINGISGGGTETLTFSGLDPFVGAYQAYGTDLTVTGLSKSYPEWWGIDGNTDETQFQKAVDATSGGKVELVAGKNYIFTSAGILLDDDNTHLYASSMATITTAADIDMIAIGPASSVNVTNIFLVNTHGTPTNANFKFNGKAKHCILESPRSNGGRYAIEMDGTAGSDPGLISYNEIYEGWLYGTGSYVLAMTGGTINENKFYGGMYAAETVLETVLLIGNNNLLTDISFENSLGDDFSKFCVYENGRNQILSCRFEVDSHGILVNNDSATNYASSRVYFNYYANLPVSLVITNGRVMTDTYGQTQTFSGFQIAGNTGNSVISVGGSAAGQKVINIDDTTGFQLGGPIVIDEGNANEEWHLVDSISSGVSVTTKGNLDNTHLAAVTVTTEGKPYGVMGRPEDNSNATQIWAQGVPILDVDGITKMVEIDRGIAFIPVNLLVTTEADIPADTTGSEATILLLNGDNDTDNDTIDLQDGVQAGHILHIIANTLVDADDTITINMADTTCRGCPAIVMNARGENVQLLWTGAFWLVVSWDY